MIREIIFEDRAGEEVFLMEGSELIVPTVGAYISLHLTNSSDSPRINSTVFRVRYVYGPGICSAKVTLDYVSEGSQTSERDTRSQLRLERDRLRGIVESYGREGSVVVEEDGRETPILVYWWMDAYQTCEDWRKIDLEEPQDA